VVVSVDDDAAVQGTMATITWSLPVGGTSGRPRQAGMVIRSPKEAFWSLDDTKDMALAVARPWHQSAGGQEAGLYS
jgi:hypothetical protein